MSELVVQNLIKTLDGQILLDNISFTVQEDEMLVLFGPPTGGKTLLLRSICGLETIDKGAIFLNGYEITRLPTRDRNLGVVFQQYDLYPHMTVYQNIAYGLQTRHTAQSEIERRILSLANTLQLSDSLQQVTGTLSKSIQQRTALARALVKNADAYLFDEPVSELEQRLRYQVRKEISILHHLNRKPCLYITQDYSEALNLGDRIGIFADGRLHQIGTADEIQDRPANIFVARFFGSPPMNIFLGYPQRIDVRFRILSGEITLQLPTYWSRALSAYQRPNILLGLRPSAILPPWQLRYYPQQRPLQAMILEVEPLIDEVILHLQLRGNTKIVAQFPSPDEDTLLPGQIIQIGIDMQQIWLFDARTQQALTPDTGDISWNF